MNVIAVRSVATGKKWRDIIKTYQTICGLFPKKILHATLSIWKRNKISESSQTIDWISNICYCSLIYLYNKRLSSLSMINISSFKKKRQNMFNMSQSFFIIKKTKMKNDLVLQTLPMSHHPLSFILLYCLCRLILQAKVYHSPCHPFIALSQLILSPTPLSHSLSYTHIYTLFISLSTSISTSISLQVSISSMFYVCLFRTKVFLAAFL